MNERGVLGFKICLGFFLQREATQSAVMPPHVVHPSVCLSVHLSGTFMYRDYIAWNTSKIIYG